MAAKREIREEERKEQVATMEEDRLTSLPDDLKICIFSYLDLKDAVQISVLSKSWVSIWTRIPVLKFHCYAFNKFNVFDNFVNKVLCLRDQSATLEELTFKHHCAACCKNILKKVFDYAFTHSVEELNVYIDNCRDGNWPVSLDDSSESSTSLNLECVRHMSFRFLGLRSGSFKNLTDLELDGATITDLEAFSGFPELKRLILFNCDIDTEGEILRVNAPNLATLIISTSFHESFNCCELTTPNLKIFCYEGIEFPRIQTHEALPVLETLCISFLGMDYGTMDHMKEKRKFDDLFSMFCEFRNAKFVLLLSPVIALLYLYEDELVKRCPPFRKLKNLMLDFKGCKVWSSTICSRIASKLKGYFLQNSPDAKFTMINSDVDELQGNKLFADLLETSFSPIRK